MKITIINNDWEKELLLEDLLSKYEKTILYFYPKDNTPWCSLEAMEFTEYKKFFNKNWIWIIWISKDSSKSHISFIEKQNLDIDLISDTNLDLHNKFSVIWEKKNYGKIYQWVIRSTFLVDDKWEILQEWRNVRAKWHVERLIKELNINIL
jgi:peroxiredoxin Q/BCP